MSWIERTELLLGDENIKKLTSAHVLVVGLGGVGAYAAEMICRAGVGTLTIIDADVVAESNINRQLIALNSTKGESKAKIMAIRLKDINPDVNLNVIDQYIKDEKVIEVLDSAHFDFVVDAIDTLSPKVTLILETLKRNYPLVSSMGAGGKTDPTKVEITDIANSHHCPLAFALRKRLHRAGVRSGFKAVFSPEDRREGALIRVEEQNKKSNVGTISYLPAIFGCYCASVVIRGLVGELEN